MTIQQEIQLRKVRETQRRGRPLTVDQVQVVLAITDNGDRDAMIERAVEAVRRYDADGKRLTGPYLEGVKLLDPRLAADIMAKHQPRRRSALTGAERQAAMVSRNSDISPLPEIADPERRQKYREDLIGFGLTYMAHFFEHAPSPDLCAIVRLMQQAVLVGGKIHVRLPRGKGKSTWSKVAAVWALLYGHRHYAVVIAATSAAAKKMINDVRSALSGSDLLAADFPEVCYPLQRLGNAPQRAPYQHIAGEHTQISLSADGLTLPTVAGSSSSGSIIEARGITGAIRGLVKEDRRPDLILLDDPQTRKSANSASETDTREELIVGDVYGLPSHGTSEAIFMSSTPIRDGDLSCRFADVNRHAEFVAETFPLIKTWPKRLDLWEEFAALYRQDSIAKDLERTLSRTFYADHQAEMDEGAELFDPLDGARPAELSALHHAMLKRVALGEKAFDAEYQMVVKPAEALLQLEPSVVANKLNGVPEYVIPRECREVVGYCDVNATADAALRWSLVAVGPGNTAAIIAYGRYPAAGRLYPKGCTETEEDQAVARGLVEVTGHIARLPISTFDGRRKHPYVLAIDGGWKTRAVSSFVRAVSAPFLVTWTKGFGWSNYRPNAAVGQPGNHCHLSESRNGTFLAIAADYWREFSQRALMGQPLQRGSLSLWGSEASRHAQIAEELCAEHLIDRGISDRGQQFWKWAKTGINHWADTVTGCLAVAAWHRFLADPEEMALSATVAAAAEGGPVGIRPAAADHRKKRRLTLRR